MNDRTLAVLLALGTFPGQAKPADPIVPRQAPGHPIRYYLSLPEGSPVRPPLLVCIAGADADFQGLLERFRKARGDRPFALVVPCTFSNTNRLHGEVLRRYRRVYSDEVIHRAAGAGLFPDVNHRLDWDEAGLLAILDELGPSSRPRAHLTGFSGGGKLVYRMLVRHPERLAAAVPVCPNFNFWTHGYRDAAAPAEPIPVRILTGANDPLRHYRFGGAFLPAPPLAVVLCAGLVALLALVQWRRTRRWRKVAGVILLGLVLLALIEAVRWTGNDAQSDAAYRLLADLGHTDVQREVIADMGHDPAPGQVVRALFP